MGRTKKIVIVAGDSSGDMYSGLLAEKLINKDPALEIFSFAGKYSKKHTRQIINLLQYSVSGIVEVASHLAKILSVFKETVSRIREIRPDLIILVDFPDFNLRLAKKLNGRFPIFYYVSPQIWAWRKKRINIIKKYINKMVVIFRFEKDFYEKENIDVLYFGHPLLEIVKKQINKTKDVISFLPGSRQGEIKRHLPIMQKAKGIIDSETKGYRFQIVRPREITKDFYEKLSDMEVVDHSYDTLGESKFIVASSGTATVEIAILKIPHIIIYKVNPLSWYILKKLVNTKFIGMVNILNGKKVVEELLQKDVTPRRIASSVLKYLNDPNKHQRLIRDLSKTEVMLSPHGATERFAGFLTEYLASAG